MRPVIDRSRRCCAKKNWLINFALLHRSSFLGPTGCQDIHNLQFDQIEVSQFPVGDQIALSEVSTVRPANRRLLSST